MITDPVSIFSDFKLPCYVRILGIGFKVLLFRFRVGILLLTFVLNIGFAEGCGPQSDDHLHLWLGPSHVLRVHAWHEERRCCGP